MGFPSKKFPNPPAYQLALLIERVRRPEEKLVDACRRAGISDRTRREWLTGDRMTAYFNVADRILLRLGVLWWEVWTPENTSPDDLARVEFAFTGEWPNELEMAA